jgi:hypothetical protein
MTADQRLALIRPKIERADKHIQDLKAAVRSFLDSQPYKIANKRDLETRKLLYYVVSVDLVPASIATIAGDILHCLRDSLDHLTQQLYLVGTGDGKGYRDQTTFPIMPSAKVFKTELAKRVEGMRQDAVDMIKGLEPYKGGQGEDLWVFNRLNNIDKHRLIVTVGSAFRSMDIGAVAAQKFNQAFPQIQMPELSLFMRPADNKFPLKAGDELFIDAADAEVNEKIKFCFEVAIHEPGVIDGKPLVETLVQFRGRVSGIVDAFRPCLW